MTSFQQCPFVLLPGSSFGIHGNSHLVTTGFLYRREVGVGQRVVFSGVSQDPYLTLVWREGCSPDVQKTG